MGELAGRRRWWTLVVLSLGVSLIVIDGTIVNVSLPVIIADLHLGLTGAQWVSTIDTLVFAGLLITTGRLGSRRASRAAPRGKHAAPAVPGLEPSEPPARAVLRATGNHRRGCSLTPPEPARRR